MEDVHLEGIWWLPDAEERKFGGILDFSAENGARLKLFGAFKELTHLMDTGNYPVVHGIADGKAVTLFDCMETNARLSGYLSQGLLIRIGCIGAHLQEITKEKFPEATVSYTGMDSWVGGSGFGPGEGHSGGDKVQVSYSFTPEIEAKTSKGNIFVGRNFHQSFGTAEVTLREEAHLRIESVTDLTIDEWLTAFVGPLQNLFTLAEGSAVGIETLSVSLGSSADDGPGQRRLPLELFFQQPSHIKTTTERPNFWMLFTLTDIRDRLDNTFESWLQVADELDSVCNLFFSVQYSAPLFLENKFLPITQAAESYHRRRMKNQVLSSEEFGARINSVVANAPDEIKDWLKQKLTYGNEPNLRVRLRELVERTEPIVGSLIKSVEGFISSVVDTRNYLTHYDESLRDKAVTGERLYHLSQIVSFLVQACLLMELGIEPEQAAKLFDRLPAYQFAKRQAS